MILERPYSLERSITSLIVDLRSAVLTLVCPLPISTEQYTLRCQLSVPHSGRAPRKQDNAGLLGKYLKWASLLSIELMQTAARVVHC